MRFKATPLSVLAERLGGEIEGDASVRITGVATIFDAGPGELTFAISRKYARHLATSSAAAVIVERGLTGVVPGRAALLRVERPQLAFARAVTWLMEPEAPQPGIWEGAHVHPTASIGPGVTVMSGAYVGAGSEVGAGTVLHPQVAVMENVVIGRDCLLYPGVVVREECRVGDRVILNPNVAIGGDGYGFTRDGATHIKIPQVGNVVIGDDVEIGANSCIDRAALGSTVIGRGTKLDSLVMIGHGTRLGEDVLVVAQSGIAGSTNVGDRATIAGRVGVADHMEIGADSLVYSGSLVTKAVPPHAVVSGVPAREHRNQLHRQALPALVEKLAARIAELEKQVAGLKRTEG